MTSKVQPLQAIEPLTEKTWDETVIFVEQKSKDRNGKKVEIFLCEVYMK